MFKNSKIGIIGLGMVGMPFKKYFEEKEFERGKNLFLCDKDAEKDFRDDINKADIIFICVPTPKKADGSCDTSIVESVAAKFKNSKKILVIKSTVPPGTALRLKNKYNLKIFFSPEFLTEANAWNDFIKPDRQIVGHTNDAKFAAQLLDLLPSAPFFSPNKNLKINASESEMGKYAANVFGAMKVAYGNIIYDFCAALQKVFLRDGIKTETRYDNVKEILANDKRIGPAWLNVHHGNYRGYGGYCFPKDTDAFIVFAKKMEKRLSSKNKEEKNLKILLKSGISFLEKIRDYNAALLKSQGLTLEEVSHHDNIIEEKMKALKNKNSKKIKNNLDYKNKS